MFVSSQENVKMHKKSQKSLILIKTENANKIIIRKKEEEAEAGKK